MRPKDPNSLRYYYGAALYQQARDLRAVQKQLGHANIQTTTVYADVSV